MGGRDREAVLRVVSSVGGVVEAEARAVARVRRFVVVTSTNCGIEGSKDRTWAAVRWLSAAPGPATRRAATSRPRTGIASCPTA